MVETIRASEASSRRNKEASMLNWRVEPTRKDLSVAEKENSR